MPQQKPKSQTQGELKLAEGKNKPAKIKYTPTPDLFTKAKGKKEDWRPKGATRESFSLEYPGRAEREAARAAERAKLAEQQRIDSMQKKFGFMEEKPLRSGKGRGALGVALAAMGGAGMADEAWAAGMDQSNVKRTGGGRGTYQPPIRRSAFNVREQ